MKSSRHINRARRLIVALLALWNLGMLACSSAEADLAAFPGSNSPEPGWFGGTRGEVYQDDDLIEAERQLSSHQISTARESYERIISSNLGSPSVVATAKVGRALTNVMLLPGSAPARQLLTMHLGATNAAYDIEKLVWAESGILDWLSSGVRWEDDGELSGVKSLVRSNLPWSIERLDSLPAFVQGLDRPMDLAMSDLLDLANRLQVIEQDLQSAEDTLGFEYFLIPSGAFHNENLTLTLGKSEVQALRGTLALARGVIYAVAAYQHRWTPDGAWGDGWTSVAADPMDPEHIPGYSADDYAWSYLDPLLARDFHDSARLEGARGAFRSGLLAWSAALRSGPQSTNDRANLLAWSSADAETLENTSDVLSALADSLDGPAEIPWTEPATRLDLSSFFTPGRTLPDEIAWFERVGETWGVRDAAIQAFFLDGVVTPTPNLLDGDALPLLLGSEGALSELFDVLTEERLRAFEDAYFSTF